MAVSLELAIERYWVTSAGNMSTQMSILHTLPY